MGSHSGGMDLLDLLLGDEDFSGERVLSRAPRPAVVDLRTLEAAVARQDAAAVRALEEASAGVEAQAEWRLLVEETVACGRAVVEGRYMWLVRESRAGRYLLREHAAEKEGALPAACDSLRSLVRTLGRRVVSFVVDGAGCGAGGETAESSAGAYRDAPEAMAVEDTREGWEEALEEVEEAEGAWKARDVLGMRPAAWTRPEAYRAAQAGWVAAALLCLYWQSASTGPELSPAQLQGVYPLPFARSWLERVAPREAAEQLGAVDATSQMRARREREAARSLAAGEHMTGGGAAGAGASGEEEDVGVSVLLPRSHFHGGALHALQQAAGGAEVYELTDVPHWLVTSVALFRALTGVGVALRGERAPAAPADVLLDGVGVAEEAKWAGMTHVVRHCNPGVAWWCGRAHAALAKTLVAPATAWEAGLCALVRESFRTAGRALSPHCLAAFTVADVFQHRLVHAQLLSTGVAELRAGAAAAAGAADGGEEALLESDGARELYALAHPSWERLWEHVLRREEADAGVRVAVQAAQSLAPWTSLPLREWIASRTDAAHADSPEAFVARQTAARLILEWGLALFTMERRNAARTCFFLAKRDSGLATDLRGTVTRRTTTQSFDVAVLVLRARSEQPPAPLLLDTGYAPSGSPGKAADLAGHSAASAPAGALAAAEPKSAVVATEPASASASAAAVADAASASDSAESAAAGAAEGAGAIGASSEGGKEGSGELATTMTVGVPQVELGRLGHQPSEDRDLGVVPDNLTWSQVSFSAAEWRAKLGRGADDPEERRRRFAEVALRAASAAEFASASASASKRVHDGAMSVLDQLIVLALCQDVSVRQPEDGLVLAEMEPYVTRVLARPQDWVVHSCGLLARVELDHASHKTKDRAVLQLQALLDQQVNRATWVQGAGSGDASVVEESGASALASSSSVGARIKWLGASQWPLHWALRRQLADRFKEFGALASAAEHYAALQLWDELVECTLGMNRPRRAKRIVEARLAAAPSSRLWHLKGIIDDDDAAFERGWTLSGGTDARLRFAQARRLFGKGDLATCERMLREALARDGREARNWFLLGSVCMRIDAASADAPASADGPRQPLRRAADAFRECVRRDGSLAEAWANLAAVLGRLARPREALVAMERAVEIQRGTWRMWDNVATLAMQCDRFSTACHALRQVIDLRHSDPSNPVVDPAVFRPLVRAACDPATAGGRPLAESPLLARVADLLAHATAATNRWELWDWAAAVDAARQRHHDVPEHLRRCLRAMDAEWEGCYRGVAPRRSRGVESALDALREIVRVLKALVHALLHLEQATDARRVLDTYIDRIHASDAFRTHPLLDELQQLRSTLPTA